jgi:ribosomal protein S18 acetylase RimI-like enzyme
MKNESVLRRATKSDISFLAKIILLAETSGKELISYREMFNIPDKELLKGFEIALDNEQLGHGLTYLTFLVVEIDGVLASASCGYIEGEHGSSNHLMTGALISGFSTEAVIGAFKKNSKFKDVQINKSYEALQIDSVATLADHRGKGLFKLIFDEHCRLAKQQGCKQLEIQVWAGNEGAIAAYKKLGCEITNEKYMTDNKNDGGRLVMTKKLG